MITVDQLSAAAHSPHVVFSEFMHYYRPDRQIVYGLVEGRDDPAFYRGAIDPFLPHGWIVKLIPAGTKNKVLEAFQIKEWERYPKGCVCFFVDRDFADVIPEVQPTGSNLYVTDNYSIECEIVNFRVAQRTMEEIMGVTKLTIEESENLQALFEHNLTTFRETLAPLMAQVILWRRSGMRPCLENFDPLIFFEFVDGQIFVKAEFADPAIRLSTAAAALNTPVSPQIDCENVETEFRQANGVLRFTRGKYLLRYLLGFVASVHASISKFCAKHPVPPKPRVSLGPKNVMAETALRARCPESLKAFIEQNFVSYIREVQGGA
jgi:hypothetical protein